MAKVPKSFGINVLQRFITKLTYHCFSLFGLLKNGNRFYNIKSTHTFTSRSSIEALTKS